MQGRQKNLESKGSRINIKKIDSLKKWDIPVYSSMQYHSQKNVTVAKIRFMSSSCVSQILGWISI